MSPAGAYSLIAFVTGILLLLGWAYVTIDNPRSNAILVKSVWLFVIPGVLLSTVPSAWLQIPLSMWLGVAAEECLKAIAARTEESRFNRFWLISLFGAWELALFKPLWGLSNAQLLSDWNRLQIAGLVGAGVVTVLMHTVTASIYAFRFRGRLWAAFLMSWVVHTSFNESVDIFGVSLLVSLGHATVLMLVLAAIWQKPFEQDVGVITPASPPPSAP